MFLLYAVPCTIVNMEYRYWEHNDDNFFIELTKGAFSTKIKMNFEPPEDFIGLAVGCNYHYNGHPIGYLKDNGLLIQQIKGKETGLFVIDDTIIQAGPILVEDDYPRKDYREQGFSATHILSGLQVHIGQKKSGNILIGMTKKNTYAQIIKKYCDYNTTYALKLPGRNQGSFYYKSEFKEVREGLFPIPCALVLCKKNS